MRAAATAQTAVPAPDRSQSPRCPCKAPPKFYHPMVRLHRRGTAPDSICRFGGRLVQNAIGRIATWRAPQLTKWFDARRSAALAKSVQEAHHGHFRHRPAPAALIELLPPTRAVN